LRPLKNGRSVRKRSGEAKAFAFIPGFCPLIAGEVQENLGITAIGAYPSEAALPCNALRMFRTRSRDFFCGLPCFSRSSFLFNPRKLPGSSLNRYPRIAKPACSALEIAAWNSVPGSFGLWIKFRSMESRVFYQNRS
jgi:hypothetical protein